MNWYVHVVTGQTLHLMNWYVHVVTDEIHFWLDCDFYSDLRYTLTENACILFEFFLNLDSEDKLIFLMSSEDIQPFLAKTLHNMLSRRNIVCNNMHFNKS